MTEDRDGVGNNSNAARRARVERIIRLTEERQVLAGDIKEIFLEEKSAGGDVKVLRHVVKQLMEDDEARAERERVQAEADLTLAAIGPLGMAAVESRSKIRAVG